VTAIYSMFTAHWYQVEIDEGVQSQIWLHVSHQGNTDHMTINQFRREILGEGRFIHYPTSSQ
jgi:hypothetical protein